MDTFHLIALCTVLNTEQYRVLEWEEFVKYLKSINWSVIITNFLKGRVQTDILFITLRLIRKIIYKKSIRLETKNELE